MADALPSNIRDVDCLPYDPYHNADRDMENEGKWMIFADFKTKDANGETEMDRVWSRAVSLVDERILTRAKCTTSKRNANAEVLRVFDPKSYDKGVVICYTRDYLDKHDVKKAALAMRQSGYKERMFYKTNRDSKAGRYMIEGCKNVTTYKFSEDDILHERDENYVWVPSIN